MPRTPRYWSSDEDEILRRGIEDCHTRGVPVDWCAVATQLPGRTNKDCRKRWHNAVTDGINKGQWTKAEDELLIQGVREFGQKKWPLVAEVVKNRAADQCAKRWQQSLNPELDRSEWTDPEDETLLEAVRTTGRHWTQIQCNHFPGRSKNAIKNRYSVLTRRLQKQSQEITAPVPNDDAAAEMDVLVRWQSSSSDMDQDSIYNDNDSGNEDNDDTPPMEPPVEATAVVDWMSCDYSAAAWPFGSSALPSSCSTASTAPDERLGSTTSNFSLSPHWSSSRLAPGATPAVTSPNTTLTPATAHPGPPPGDPFQPPGIMDYGLHSLGISPLGGPMMPDAGQVREQGIVQFTLRINQPNVDTMQQLVRIAMETQARFKVERE